MGFFQDALLRLNRAVMSYAGDAAFMQAAVSAAANVIAADSDTDEAEIEAALVGLRANPILEKSYDTLALEGALFEALARAELRAGRLENLQQVAAIPTGRWSTASTSSSSRRTWPTRAASRNPSTGCSTSWPRRSASTRRPCSAEGRRGARSRVRTPAVHLRSSARGRLRRPGRTGSGGYGFRMIGSCSAPGRHPPVVLARRSRSHPAARRLPEHAAFRIAYVFASR